nr:MAG TPA: RNA polymerase-like protein [Caudoviricetes sp.]
MDLPRSQLDSVDTVYSLAFLGNSKTVNRCAACGYSWKPGK